MIQSCGVRTATLPSIGPRLLAENLKSSTCFLCGLQISPTSTQIKRMATARRADFPFSRSRRPSRILRTKRIHFPSKSVIRSKNHAVTFQLTEWYLSRLITHFPLRLTLPIACDAPHFYLRSILRMNLRPALLIEFARQLEFGPCGRVGERPAQRYLALCILSHVLQQHPKNVKALCLKGELLLPVVHYGRSYPTTPLSVLEEALSCFDAASHDPTGLFLKGRLLVTMEAIHNDVDKSKMGKACVLKAASSGCGRASVFLAHRYEYPQLDQSVSFASDVPKDRDAKQRFIVNLYKKAAEANDPDGLNDLGTSYSEGYGGLQPDFDVVVDLYLRAIEAGSIHAYDNLGTHYETGMGRRAPDRIDYERALFYYKQGVQRGCPKCASNLAAAYEEGMGDVLPKDLTRARRYYMLCLKLCNDCNDLQTAGRAVSDLMSLLVTVIKLKGPASTEARKCEKLLGAVIPSKESSDEFLGRINKALFQAIRNRSKRSLVRMVGEENSSLLFKKAKDVWNNSEGLPEADHEAAIEQMFGDYAFQSSEPPRKKRNTARRGQKKK